MTTTAVFAEILTVGLQALFWMGLGVYAAAGWGEDPAVTAEGIKAWLAALSDWAALITVAVLALAYAVGVVVDRIADTLMDKVLKRLRPGGPRPPDEESKDGIAGMRMYVRHKSGSLGPFLDYVRSRLRVARSTVVNIVPATVFGALAVRDPWWAVVAVVVLGVAALWAAGYAWRRIERVYVTRLHQAYELMGGTRAA